MLQGNASGRVYAEATTQKETPKETQKNTDKKGHVTIQVLEKNTKTVLHEGRFILQEWSEKKGAYMEVEELVYEVKSQCFKTHEIVYTSDNLGKFKIIETENQSGYYGEWEQEFTLIDEQSFFEYEVFNSPNEGQMRIQKKNVSTGEILKNDKFKLQEWDSMQDKYVDTGVELLYDEELQTYNSGAFYYTSKNRGKFKIVQEVIEAGKEHWSQEIQLTKNIQMFEYIIDFVEEIEDMEKVIEVEEKSGEEKKDPEKNFEEIIYGIYVAEDITLPDGTSYKKGELAQIAKVDEQGFLSIENLQPYKYYIQEIRDTKISIEIIEISSDMEEHFTNNNLKPDRKNTWESQFVAAVSAILLTMMIAIIFKFQK